MPKIVDDEGHAFKAILLLVFGMSFIPLNDALIKIIELTQGAQVISEEKCEAWDFDVLQNTIIGFT